ncbi:unnamed protein product, partial [Oppiella nova]
MFYEFKCVKIDHMFKMNFANKWCFVLMVCLIERFVCDESNSVVVNTSSGGVRGQTLNVVNHFINQFLNIPYAEPPVGPRRFSPPQPLKTPKKDIIDGTVEGNSCIQIQSPLFIQLMGKLTTSEDCLVLNIWTPNVDKSASKSQLKPVMYWIYGGALTVGSVFQKFYNGSVLATNDVVIVSVNYRVGQLGFLYFYNGSVLATNDVVIVSVNYRVGQLGFLYGGDQTAPGNLGFYDQLLGLKWVRENIHEFGGDKDQITIFGESAGSWSTSAHILSPLSKRLFKRAIVQSAAEMFHKDRPVLGTVEALSKAKETARKLGCDPYDYKWLGCLRAIENPDLFLEPTEADVDVMAGATKDEGHVLAVKLQREIYHNIDVQKISDYYLQNRDPENPNDLQQAFDQLYGDMLIVCPTYGFAKRFVKSGRDTNLFAMLGCDEHTICHGAELPYVFGDPVRTPQMFTETDYDFSLDIMKIWTNFAKNIKPHNVWPKLIDISDANSVPKVKDLNPNDMSLVLDNPYGDICDGFWSEY